MEVDAHCTLFYLQSHLQYGDETARAMGSRLEQIVSRRGDLPSDFVCAGQAPQPNTVFRATSLGDCPRPPPLISHISWSFARPKPLTLREFIWVSVR